MSLLCTTPMVWANPQLEGEYALQGGALYLLPQQKVVVIGYATAFAGSYTIQGDTINFHWFSEKYPKIMVHEFLDPSEELPQKVQALKPNQLRIHFDSGLSEPLYLGINQPVTSPQLKRVFNENVNCYEYSKMNYVLTGKSKNTLLLYQEKTTFEPAFMQQYQIPEHVNQIEIRMNKNELAHKNFQATIQKEGLIIHQGHDVGKRELSKRHALSEVAAEDLAMVRQIVQHSQLPMSFNSQSVSLKNIQLDHHVIVTMQCDTGQ